VGARAKECQEGSHCEEQTCTARQDSQEEQELEPRKPEMKPRRKAKQAADDQPRDACHEPVKDQAARKKECPNGWHDEDQTGSTNHQSKRESELLPGEIHGAGEHLLRLRALETISFHGLNVITGVDLCRAPSEFKNGSSFAQPTNKPK